MKRLAHLLLLVAGINLSACYQLTVSGADAQHELDFAYETKNKQAFYVWGLIGEKDVFVREYCEGELPSQWLSEFSPGDLLLCSATLGMLCTRTNYYWCHFQQQHIEYRPASDLEKP